MVLNLTWIFLFLFQKLRPNTLAPPVSAVTAAVVMGSAELAILPSSPSFAATLGGVVNPHILVVDIRKAATTDEGKKRICLLKLAMHVTILLSSPIYVNSNSSDSKKSCICIFKCRELVKSGKSMSITKYFIGSN